MGGGHRIRLWPLQIVSKHVALRPQKPDVLLGTGKWGEGALQNVSSLLSTRGDTQVESAVDRTALAGLRS